MWLRLEMVGSYRSVGASMAFPSVPESSSYLPGILSAEEDDARDDSCRASFTKRLYLPAKPSHVGGRRGQASLPSAPAYDS
jgi:hypothetical protein